MLLEKLLDVNLLAKHITEKVVSAQLHPIFPLAIYNYTQRAQFENIWDDVTRKARGLIVNVRTQEIIARPFEKFFNLNTLWMPETLEANLAGLKAEVSEKLDGSLGVLYQWEGDYHIATRGSFVSDQAQWANRWYRQNMFTAVWPDNKTPLFEIIYRENKIVVDYDYEGMVLLAVVDNETGIEWPREGLERAAKINSCRIAKKFDKSLAECVAENSQGEEGYVLRYVRESHSLRIKVKFAEYVRLHKLLTGVSPKAIWELLRDTGSVASLCENVPETFVTWVRNWEQKLFHDYVVMETNAKAEFEKILHTFMARGGQPERKHWAEKIAACDQDLHPILFRMLDARKYDDIIWKRIRPEVKQGDVFRKDPDTTGA